MTSTLIHTAVSFFTLNALLQIYDVQPVEFYESQQLINHPKFQPIFSVSNMFNLLICALALLSLNWKRTLASIGMTIIVLSVILQNLMFYFPKSINMLLIYYQFIVIVIELSSFGCILFEKMTVSKKQDISPIEFNRSKKSIEKREVPKEKLKEKRRKQVKQVKKEEGLQLDLNQQIVVPPQSNEFQQEDQEIMEIVELKLQESEDVTQGETEYETETVGFEMNHVDLSEISSVKSEPRLSFVLYMVDATKSVNCTYDSFDSSFDFLEQTYTKVEVIQVKIHILLNLYDDNEDSCCRLWAMRMLLALQNQL